MKKKTRVGIAILSMLSLVICGFILYELFDSKVNLDSADSVTEGKWCIKIKDVSKVSLKGQADSSEVSVDKTSLKFKASFKDKDDNVEYNFKIKNCGSVDAYLYGTHLDGPEREDALLYVLDGIEVGDTIKKGEVVSVRASITPNDDEDRELDLNLNLNFSQVD